MNDNLNVAKTAKNDEFYTQYADIEREAKAYVAYDKDVFRDKTILLPCDDPERSNFTRYFLDHFEDYGIGKLISTCNAPQMRFKSPLFTGTGHGRYLVRMRGEDASAGFFDGDGDFRSAEITELRDAADIIVTNPPFSLFREFIEWIRGKHFLVLGNMNAITYKEIFPLIMRNEVWTGITPITGSRWFEVGDPKFTNKYMKIVDEKRLIPIKSVWYTNLEHGRRHEPLTLHTMEDNVANSKHGIIRKNGYQHYDNYDAIDVPFTDAIPSDYDGVMGVPISFLDRYCPEQFEIVGNEYSLNIDKGRGYIDGKRIYSRIFIRHRHPKT